MVGRVLVRPGVAGQGRARQGIYSKRSAMKVKIDISKIVLDETIYPRSQFNEFLVPRMMAALDAGSKFPPLIVEAGTYRLVDGWHRHEMYRRKGIEKIDVTPKSYLSIADLFADAVRLNIGRGADLTAYDVKSAIAKLEALGYERDKISEIVRIPVEKITEIIKGFAKSEDGEPIALKGGLQHRGGSTLEAHQAGIIRRYGGHQGTFYIRQLIMLIETDMWPRNSSTFSVEMDRLFELWSKITPRSEAA